LIKDFDQENIEANYFNSEIKTGLLKSFKKLNEGEKKIRLGLNPVDIVKYLKQDYEKNILRGNLIVAEKESNLSQEMEKEVSALPIITINRPNKDQKKRKRKSLVYECQVEGCNYIAKCSQGLGGHMSKKHPKTSKKFLSKVKTREERADVRECNLLQKKHYMSLKGHDYDEQSKSREGRNMMKALLQSKEFKQFKRFTAVK
jgi:hypothetical protein